MTKELKAGHIIQGKYEIVRKYGEGSLGDDVYIGTHIDLKREILVRILPESMTSDPDVANRFIQGVKLTASLQHPNILPAYDAGEEDGNFFFITGFEKGFFLDEYILQRGRLGEKEAVEIMIPLASALKQIWVLNQIIHRNICPQVILLARGNQPMLTDFGLAKSHVSGRTSTLSGFTIGNPQYMSPEQVTGDLKLNFHADMYCLGLVFYEMLAGHPAFQSDSRMVLMDAQLSKKPANLKDENRNISDNCVKIIDKMLEKDREKRFISWEELIKSLKSLLEEQKPEAAPEPKPAKKSKMSDSEIADRKIREFKKVLQEDKKRRVKRNILIIFILINIAIAVIGIKMIRDKMRKAREAKPAPQPQLNLAP